MNRIDIRMVQPRLLTNQTYGFRFKLLEDRMSVMRYVEAFQSGKSVGHLDFSIIGKWMLAHYGCFATSQEQSLSEWSGSAIKDIAIEVEKAIRDKFRGVGSAMASVALLYGKRKGLEGMKIIDSNPNTQPFWEKLGFKHDGADMLFKYSEKPIPPIIITEKNHG